MFIRHALNQEFKTLADPARAAQQQAYTKSSMRYLGITMPILRKTAKTVFADNPLETRQQWRAHIADLWRNARFREERYAAIELMGYSSYQRQWLSSAILPLIREMIETGAWWDFVDNLAVNHVGKILLSEPDSMYPTLAKWSQEENLWIRRTAILAQLKFKEKTDVAFLFDAIEGSIADHDFFARKAIGWALREYSKTDAISVIKYVERNENRLSPLSKKEALRILIARGVIDD